MRKVKWKNLWNWTSEEGGVTRIHITQSDGLAGITLCNRAFPRRKGYPTAVRYCKTCVKKSKLSIGQLNTLAEVPSAEE